MSTTLQIATNILNAQASTGPTSITGKAISSQNARKHGLYTAVENLNQWERQDYEAALAAYSERYAPATPEEESLVAEVALAFFRIQRARAMESGYIESAINGLVESGEIACPQSAEEYRSLYGRVYYRDAASSKALSKLFSMECRLIRQQEKAQKQLEALIEARRPTENKSTSPKLASFHQPVTSSSEDTARNAPCPCGSGQKYKRCCGKDANPTTMCDISQSYCKCPCFWTEPQRRGIHRAISQKR